MTFPNLQDWQEWVKFKRRYNAGIRVMRAQGGDPELVLSYVLWPTVQGKELEAYYEKRAA